MASSKVTVQFKKPSTNRRRNGNLQNPDTFAIERSAIGRARSNPNVPGTEKENTRSRTLRSDLSDSNLSLSMKGAANKTLTTVKTAFDSLSDKLRKSARRGRVLTTTTYGSLENNNTTPVKLYSPFCIATPSPNTVQNENPLITPEKRLRYTPKRFDFSSPTGNLRNDIKDISVGMNDLNVIAAKVQRKVKKNS